MSTEIAVTIQKPPSRDVGGAMFAIIRGKRVNTVIALSAQSG